jgi:release factor glutamine methyltransferase
MRVADLYQIFKISQRDLMAIVGACLGCERVWLMAHPEHELTQTQLEIVSELVARFELGEPMAYILGFQDFYGLRFTVNPDVLIPRPETELLVEQALRESFSKVLDLGAGSGCIGLTLAKVAKPSSVTLVDISAAALAVAQKNADRLKVSVACLEADFCQEEVWEAWQGLDLIVSNPPYIGYQEVVSSSLAFEPQLALYAEQEGLACYHALLSRAAQVLTPGGRLVCEIGYQQGKAVADLLSLYGWRKVDFYKDYQGHTRGFVARK